MFLVEDSPLLRERLEALLTTIPGVRVVYVLTNFANDGYRRAAERLGARGFFDKSNDIGRLREALVPGVK